MRTWLAKAVSNGYQFAQVSILVRTVAAAFAVLSFGATAAFAQSAHEVGGEASLKLPDLSQVLFLGIDGHRLLMIGILFCIFGLGFGLVIYTRLRNMPVHRAMLEISELIYETCKTYLITQGKFLLHPVAVHCGRDRTLLRCAVARARTSRLPSPCRSF